MDTITTSKSRETETLIDTIRYENGCVTLLCTSHERTIDFDSMSQARPFKSCPSEWCEECAISIYGVGL
jgi:hypothetical protein